MGRNKKICVISFSLIRRDARLLREIKYLLPHYDLVVIGFGPRPAMYEGDKRLTWHDADIVLTDDHQPGDSRAREVLRKSGTIARLALARDWKGFWWRVKNALEPRIRYRLTILGCFTARFYEQWYWNAPMYKNAFDLAANARCDAFLANDWNSLPIAARAAKETNARLVFDAHEYAPLEYETLDWKLRHSPMITHFLHALAPCIDGSVTVGPGIQKKYKEVFGLDPIVVRNAPERVRVPFHATDPGKVRLIHHGGAVRLRKLEDFIEIVCRLDNRYQLHYMLIGQDTAYIRELQDLGEKKAPGRVFFHDPVKPWEVVKEISQYDMSICFKKPLCFNEKYSLPNKFFDSIAAGLAVLAGPSPEMGAIIRQYGLGLVAPSFDLADVAGSLNTLKAHEIMSMRKASQRASLDINAQTELKKLVALFSRVMAASKTGKTRQCAG